ncbi:CPCC family cysteine-rich protein [Leeia aquatica]|uniref:Cysteine-rich CPCC domain-containing protein n=1 Tax=Leeia aquatica TaxID=2725557 RepID=A0A847RSS7_9NEIS|nr:CPCC family cysteine-rich protein [Leeia aquatica]NLR74260.1 hypothetical protein [Leeia aquatica]
MSDILQTQALVQCDCCDYFCIPAGADYEICPVCFWEQDAWGISKPDQRSGANHGLTLRQGRNNFLQLGACAARFKQHVMDESMRRHYRHVPRHIIALETPANLCPYCEQDAIWRVRLKAHPEYSFLMCFECDAVWDSHQPVSSESGSTFPVYMQSLGLIPDWNVERLETVDWQDAGE